MSQPHLTSLSPEEQDRRLWRGFGRFIDQITPSLFALGVWLFGGLIAFNLLVLASLFTVGPVDWAVKLATAAFALALPLNLTGLVLLRMVQELKGVGFEDQLMQAFQEEGFVSDQIPAPADLEATLTTMRARRTSIVLRSSAVILALSVSLTLAGLTATLWHMGWWISVGFIAMVSLSILVVLWTLSISQPAEPTKQI